MAPRPIEGNWRGHATSSRLTPTCSSRPPPPESPLSRRPRQRRSAPIAWSDVECLAFALRTRQPHGIWGGLTGDERNLKTPDRVADRFARNPAATV